MIDPIARLEELRRYLSLRVTRTGECWKWNRSTNRSGYGYASFRDAPRLAHRASWTAWRGEIPDGLSVCHHCDNHWCINPAHLFLGDQAANTRDAARKGRLSGQRLTHCKRGHEFTPENTILRGSGTQRECRECNRSGLRRRRALQRLGQPEEISHDKADRIDAALGREGE